MAASDARPVPRKNTAFRLYFAIRKSDGTLITTWAGADSEVSLDGGSFSDCTNEATEIGTSGCGYIDFTAGEMNADAVVYKLTVTNTDALPLVFTLFPEELGDYRSDVGMISGDSGAADNAESFFDGTGYAGTGNVIPTVTTVNGLANNVITAASIAASALDGKGNWNVGKTGYSLTATTGLGNQTANITGSLSGSVGSVLGGIDTAFGTITRLDQLDTAQDTQHATTQNYLSTNLGLLGANLSAIPWNGAWDAEVQSEVQDAIVVNGLDHLLAASVTGTDVTDNSIFARLASKSATADWDSYVNTTDSLEAIRDRGDAAWTTGSGGGGSVVVSPIAGNAPDRVEETTLKAFVGETWSEQVGGIDAEGDVIDFTALGDLKFVLEDRNGTDVLVIANADITKNSTYFQVSIDDQYIGDVAQTMRWSLRQVTNNNVVLYGPFVVGYAADAD